MIELLELTTTDANEDAVTELAQKARSYTTAAVCVPASLIARAAAELEGSEIRVSAVIADDDPDWAARAVEAAVDEGADEVDLEIEGDPFPFVAACREHVPVLKVITRQPLLALQAGADFVVGPDPRPLLAAVADFGGGGVKVTGLAIAIAAEAVTEQAAKLLGPDWATPQTLRLGAAGVIG